MLGLHRFIAKLAGISTIDQIDHKNGNGLDNTRDNLRPANNSQNNANKKRQSNNISGVKNVSWDRTNNKWHVSIRKDGKKYHFGRYESLEEAAQVANEKSLELHGDFRRAM